MTSSGSSGTSPRSRGVEITRHDARSAGTASDMVAVEDPLEIRLGDVLLAVVMRTPGDDDDLVRGFFLTEGILLEPAEICAISWRMRARKSSAVYSHKDIGHDVKYPVSRDIHSVGQWCGR